MNNSENNNENNTETKKVLSFIALNGILCPLYEEPDEDARREWSGN